MYEKYFVEKNLKLLVDKPASSDLFSSETHSTATDTLYEIISSNNSNLRVGLEGEWGSGKSTVVSLLEKRITNSNNNYEIIILDAWSHKDDALKSVFLEKFSDKIYKKFFKKIEQESTFICQKLKGYPLYINTSKMESLLEELLTKSTSLNREIFIKNYLKSVDNSYSQTYGPTISETTIARIQTIHKYMEDLRDLDQIYQNVLGEKKYTFSNTKTEVQNILETFKFIVSIIPFVLLLAVKEDYKIIIFVIICIIMVLLYYWDSLKKRIKLSNSVFLTENIISSTSYETDKKNSSTFEKLFSELMDFAAKKITCEKVVFVIDNLDRLTPDKVKDLWTNLQVFIHDDQQLGNNLTINKYFIIPYDYTFMSSVWDESNSFLEKTFQVRVYVPNQNMNNWTSFFKEKLNDVSLENEKKEVILKVSTNIVNSLDISPTPREITVFINQILVNMKSVKAEYEFEVIVLFTYLRLSFSEKFILKFIKKYKEEKLEEKSKEKLEEKSKEKLEEKSKEKLEEKCTTDLYINFTMIIEEFYNELEDELLFQITGLLFNVKKKECYEVLFKILVNHFFKTKQFHELRLYEKNNENLFYNLFYISESNINQYIDNGFKIDTPFYIFVFLECFSDSKKINPFLQKLLKKWTSQKLDFFNGDDLAPIFGELLKYGKIHHDNFYKQEISYFYNTESEAFLSKDLHSIKENYDQYQISFQSIIQILETYKISVRKKFNDVHKIEDSLNNVNKIQILEVIGTINDDVFSKVFNKRILNKDFHLPIFEYYIKYKPTDLYQLEAGFIELWNQIKPSYDILSYDSVYKYTVDFIRISLSKESNNINQLKNKIHEKLKSINIENMQANFLHRYDFLGAIPHEMLLILLSENFSRKKFYEEITESLKPLESTNFKSTELFEFFKNNKEVAKFLWKEKNELSRLVLKTLEKEC